MREQPALRGEVLARWLSWVAVCWVGLGVVGCRPGGGGGGDAKRAEKPARDVTVVAVGTRPMERRVTAFGSLMAREQAVLGAKVSGQLNRLLVDIGSAVPEGGLVAEVERRDYELKLEQSEALLGQARARLGLPLEGSGETTDPGETSLVREARARLEEAARNRDRVKALSVQGIISASELESADAEFKVAENRYQESLSEARSRMATLAQRRVEVEIARQQLTDTRMLAPFAGVVQERRATVGGYLSVGQAVVSLVKVDPLRLRLEIPERESVAIREGLLVRVMLEGDTTVHEGRISRISPAITEQNRMLLVEADVRNPGTLRPGQFARADVVVSGAEPVPAIPVDALRVFAGVEKAVVIEGGKAVERGIRTGRRQDGYVEVLSGVKAGELVIMNPGNLQTGDAVRAGSS